MVRRRLYYRNMSLLILTMMSFLPCRFGIRLTEAWFTVQPPTIVQSVKTHLLPRQRQYYTVFSFFRPWKSTTTSTRLLGISEWRDLAPNYSGNGDDRRLGKEQGGFPKEICVLPFPYQEVLLQGETKQLRLYEDRFVQLFDDCMDHHCGVVAMGMLATSGIIQTVPVAEIEAYNRLDGFGIFVTIRVVGRAKLLDVVQQTPYLKAICSEVTDTLPPNLELYV
jgi:hypothetical protein